MALYVPLYEIEANAEPATVCVSGVTGYVAGHLVERLLAAGHTVHGTVRDPSNEKLLSSLKALPGAEERLKIFKADLLEPGSFDRAVQGCRYVCHTASPFFTPKKLQDVKPKLLEPAVNGTKNMLGMQATKETISHMPYEHPQKPACAAAEDESALPDYAKLVHAKAGGTYFVLYDFTDSSGLESPPVTMPCEAVNASPSVDRVVLTSSCAAIYSDANHKGAGVPFTEADWAEPVSETIQPYYYSKRLAEEKAWEMAKAQDRWKLVTINPTLVMGPPIGDRGDGESINVLKMLFSGKLWLAPHMGLGVVDVRDVAAAHCLAMLHPKAQGRHICSENTYSLFDLGAFVKEKYPKQKTPQVALPNWLTRLGAPILGLSKATVDCSIGKTPLFDNSKIQRELGFKFHPAKRAVQDMAARLIQLGQLKPA